MAAMNNGFDNHDQRGSLGGLAQNALNNVLGRHLSSASGSTGIVIRQVRQINGATGISIQGPVSAPNGVVSHDIVVKAVHPYSRITRTSAYWQDNGWEMRNGYLIGQYQVGDNLFPGTIEIKDSYAEPFKFYIYDPPKKILSGSHGACFRFSGKVGNRNKYWIHFNETPKDMDSGIIQVERDLAHAIGRH